MAVSLRLAQDFTVFCGSYRSNAARSSRSGHRMRRSPSSASTTPAEPAPGRLVSSRIRATSSCQPRSPRSRPQISPPRTWQRRSLLARHHRLPLMTAKTATFSSPARRRKNRHPRDVQGRARRPHQTRSPASPTSTPTTTSTASHPSGAAHLSLEHLDARPQGNTRRPKPADAPSTHHPRESTSLH